MEVKMTQTYRPCHVNGTPAKFHRWIEEDKALLKIGAFTKPDECIKLRKIFDHHGVVPSNGEIQTVRVTYALVEYENGSVKKVDPEAVVFDKVKKPSNELVDIFAEILGGKND